ncbi:MAG: hypothetical protein HYZ72_01340 [Deltaproteobacteria bacterium]|nr:hypothetical protein [Deltaproteobacteria bacterium]
MQKMLGRRWLAAPPHTIALLPGSLAIDAIPLAACTDLAGHPVAIDQRGVVRPQGPLCDIGAFEAPPADSQGPIASNVVASPNPVAINTSWLLTATLDDTTTGGSTIFSAEYQIDSDPFLPMTSQDNAFNEVSEDVTASPLYFTSAGVYNVCVRGRDAVTNVGVPACVLLVVYDPNAGFVTGGGWINSPVGAYVANPILIGKATLGFVSKYQKGAKVPTGETEFQFQMATFTFHSSSYAWMVVSGAKAQ